VTPRKPTADILNKKDGPGQYPAAPGYSGDFIQIQQKRWLDEERAKQNNKSSVFIGCRPAI